MPRPESQQDPFYHLDLLFEKTCVRPLQALGGRQDRSSTLQWSMIDAVVWQHSFGHGFVVVLGWWVVVLGWWVVVLGWWVVVLEFFLVVMVGPSMVQTAVFVRVVTLS